MNNQIQEFLREGRRRPAPGWFIGLCRIAFGLMWLYDASGKAPPSFGQGTNAGFWNWIQQGTQYSAFAWYGSFMEGVVLPNLEFYGWLAFLVELCIGLSLLTGLFTRVFSVLGMLMSLNLLIGLAAHSIQTTAVYTMMIMFHLLFTATNAGLNWGVDQILLEKLANSPLRQTAWGKRLIKIL